MADAAGSQGRGCDPQDMKPRGLIDPYAEQIDPRRLARRLYDRHQGKARRIKLRDLAHSLLGIPSRHGSAPEVALRNALSQLRAQGLPIGSLDGPDGGIFWIATDEERREALRGLYAQRRALQRAIDALESAQLEWREPEGQVALI